MPYTKTIWKDRVVQNPNTYTKSGETSSEITLVAKPGTVTEAGTPLNATNLNKLEIGVREVSQGLSTDEPTLTYDSDGNLVMVEEYEGAVIVKTTTLGYDGEGTLTTVVETTSSKTITTTLHYVEGKLTNTTKVVS